MVVIRLARGGAKKRPFYHIVAADKRRARDGKYLECIGFFNPIATGKEVKIKLEKEKLDAWVAKGAQMSDRVKSLVADWEKASKAA